MKREMVTVNESNDCETGPSTRLSNLMKRIQETASDYQNQFESFVSNVSSGAYLKKTHKIQVVLEDSQPVSNENDKQQYLFPGPVQESKQPREIQKKSSTKSRGTKYAEQQKSSKVNIINSKSLQREGKIAAGQGNDISKVAANNTLEEKRPGQKGWAVVKLTEQTPATLNCRRPVEFCNDSSKTWNGAKKCRPGLSTLDFRVADKHITCIEVTLVNNRPSSNSCNTLPRVKDETNQKRSDLQYFRSKSESESKENGVHVIQQTRYHDMPTYCFGQHLQNALPRDPLSSQDSSVESDLQTAFEESPPPNVPPGQQQQSKFRIMMNKIGSNLVTKMKTDDAGKAERTPKVKPKRSTIRREFAFRERNKKAWSRAKEIERSRELFERFSLIRKRLGEDELESDSLDSRELNILANHTSDNQAVNSVVKTLVRQYNTGFEHRSREKIVPSRLNSKRSNAHTDASKVFTKHSDYFGQIKVRLARIFFIYLRKSCPYLSTFCWILYESMRYLLHTISYLLIFYPLYIYVSFLLFLLVNLVRGLFLSRERLVNLLWPVIRKTVLQAKAILHLPIYQLVVHLFQSLVKDLPHRPHQPRLKAVVDLSPLSNSLTMRYYSLNTMCPTNPY